MEFSASITSCMRIANDMYHVWTYLHLQHHVSALRCRDKIYDYNTSTKSYHANGRTALLKAPNVTERIYQLFIASAEMIIVVSKDCKQFNTILRFQ